MRQQPIAANSSARTHRSPQTPQSLGYHSEEGWTALIDITLGHYGIEVEEKDIILFVGIIPIAIDVAFK